MPMLSSYFYTTQVFRDNFGDLWRIISKYTIKPQLTGRGLAVEGQSSSPSRKNLAVSDSKVCLPSDGSRSPESKPNLDQKSPDSQLIGSFHCHIGPKGFSD